MKKALETLKGRARVKRTMWSRRAQEYEAKINSGDLVSIAEVVRDLYRSEAQPEQSYSERQLYEAALDRMAREIAAVEKLDEASAVAKIDDVLAKTARHAKIAAERARPPAPHRLHAKQFAVNGRVLPGHFYLQGSHTSPLVGRSDAAWRHRGGAFLQRAGILTPSVAPKAQLPPHQGEGWSWLHSL